MGEEERGEGGGGYVRVSFLLHSCVSLTSTDIRPFFLELSLVDTVVAIEPEDRRY